MQWFVPAFLPNVGLPELLVILFVVLLLFGAKKLPEVARSLGRSILEFKKGIREIEKDAEKDTKDKPGE